MLSKIYENLAVVHGIEKVYEQARTIEFTFSESASKKINGERLFRKASEMPDSIKLFTKKQKVHITLEKYRFEKHFLFYLIELLETI